MILDQHMLQHQVKFEHNKPCRESKNLGYDTNCNTPNDNNRFGGVTTLHDNNKTKTIEI
jgi:hypothetical protein